MTMHTLVDILGIYGQAICDHRLKYVGATVPWPLYGIFRISKSLEQLSSKTAEEI